MTPRRTTWEDALAQSRAESAVRGHRLARQRSTLLLGWHGVLWVIVLTGLVISLAVQRRSGIPVVATTIGAYTTAITLLGWGLLRTGGSGRGVLACILGLDGLVLVAVLTLFVPDVPVALGIAVLPVIGLAAVGSARLSLLLAIIQNGLMFGIWRHELSELLLSGLGLAPTAPAQPLDIAGFAALSTTAALLATVAARSGFAGIGVLRNELAAHTRHLSAANTALTAHNEALATFNAAVGHDLRGPLTTARLAMDLVRDDCTSSEQQACVDDAIEAVERLTTMVDDLLQVARSGGAIPTKDAIPMDAVVDDALANLSAEIRSAGGRISVCGILPTVSGNRSILAEVVQNLIENALKYGGQPHPRVRITGGWVGDVAFLEVEDDGLGIPQKDRGRIFQAFEQLDGGSVGVGAGLSLVQRMVEAHSGTITVEDSRMLGGARFRVCLPIETATPLAATG